MPPMEVGTLASLKEFVGREIAVTDSLVITQERIQQFAETTGDRQWIHVDPERALIESPYKSTIAHGFFTLSLLSYFMKQALRTPQDVRMIVNYGLNRVRFPTPVLAGASIRARVALQSFAELPSGAEAIYKISIEPVTATMAGESAGYSGQGSEKPCCVAEWVIRYYT